MKTCPRCLGDGWDDRNDDSCDECGGHGHIIAVNCPDCGGTGRNERPTCLYDLAVEGACQTCLGAKEVSESKAAEFFRRWERANEERREYKEILPKLDEIERLFDE